MSLRGSVVHRIINHAPTAALLDVYATLSGPAVFGLEKPGDYEWQETPAAIVRDPTMMDDLPAFGQVQPMADAMISVAIYGQVNANTTDSDAVVAAAKSIFNLFRGVSFTGPDGILYQAKASGPIAAPVSTPALTGQIVQLRINVGD